MMISILKFYLTMPVFQLHLEHFHSSTHFPTFSPLHLGFMLKGQQNLQHVPNRFGKAPAQR